MEPKAYLLRITLGDINSLQLALDTDTDYHRLVEGCFSTE